MTSPPDPPTYRLGGLAHFLPLGEEPTLSSRGHLLPQLIQSRNSAASFTDLPKFGVSPSRSRRRPSSIDTAARRSEDDSEALTPLDSDWETGTRNGGDDRRRSLAPPSLLTPQMRSQRLIGNPNPRYRWERYYKGEAELKGMKKAIREYYERNNYLIQQYMYIDRLLDSSLPHNLIQEYGASASVPDVPPTIAEEPGQSPMLNGRSASESGINTPEGTGGEGTKKLKRTPKALYKVQDESTPLLGGEEEGGGGEEDEGAKLLPAYEPEEEADSQSRIVTVAIYVNLVANSVLLVLKIIVTVLTSSVSVLASLVDAALDFLSTAIIWTTTYLISKNDQYKYPVGRRRLEPIGVLVFSVIMITSFVQVALQGLSHLTGTDRTIVQLTIPAVSIMASTVVIKGGCWLWCRLIKNSSVQALAQDAMTDVVFNIFSIIFPLVGYYAKIWWLDPLGGILLSLYVITNWGGTSVQHIKNLSGQAASADQRNVLLYLTMRFAKTIKQIQGLNAFHSGDFLNVEADIVLDENTSLRDSHDLGESLQYVLESVPFVDRAFVHMDYAGYNLPTHMRQGD
ncbi:Metal tolerance protein 9 [Sphaceloma murrayae]|uniref:Metal tolerance protein 9 n=1 Tax=Sphaceloma murrayae TaxID=2082308 RepID=A0A2K1QK99_9PEZI|nr:Metal tolerance protein 9 [Sphaceloma murrayae]